MNQNIKYYFIGGILIILIYIRNLLFGYRTPRTFSIEKYDQAVDYDFKVVDNWIAHLNYYSKEFGSLKDKVVLELGVGQDLGTGLILLAMGVKKYIALDVNELNKSTPMKFYEVFFNKLKEKYPDCDINYLKEQLDKCYKGEDGRLIYVVDKDFKISKITNKFDVVFSQAAFEHFTNVGKTFEELSQVVRVGGVLTTEIDLKTHTRWIRDRDPLNIYRYNNFFWNIFKYKGSPNRVRPFEYKSLLEKNGWYSIEIKPLTTLDNACLEKIKPSLNKKFRNLDPSELKMLNIMVMAKKNK